MSNDDSGARFVACFISFFVGMFIALALVVTGCSFSESDQHLEAFKYGAGYYEPDAKGSIVFHYGCKGNEAKP